MLDEALNKCADNNNYTIYTSMCKAQRILMRSYDAVCSISGGSDSDIVLDLIHKVDEDGKVKYFWIDTGLEYSATKEHLDFLEQKYGITIERVKPDKPIPTCVREYGVPFLSKYVSEQMMRLQAHHFQWEDEPLEVLLQKYPRCKTALQWWCGERYSDKDGIQKISRFSIYRNRFLKEFIMANPPDFPISNKCCEYSKKKPAKRIVKEHDADLDITGIRQSEGGIRSAAYKTCFSECKSKGCNTFRPVFWYTDGDKRDYEEMFGVTHSRCYTEYGLRRTGCVGCPFSKHITEELAIIEEHEPNLYKAAVHIFGKSYDYTAKYRAFVKEMKAKEKEEKKHDRLLSLNETSACDGAEVTISSVKREVKADKAPKLYDLTTLQREANKAFGYTAQQTLDYTQSLYEGKLVTYPRTDSQFLSDDMAQTALDVTRLCDSYFGFGIAHTPDISKVINNSKVSGHHAIIPTSGIATADLSSLPTGEKNILTLIAIKLICATAPAHKYEAVKLTGICNGWTVDVITHILRGIGGG